MYLCIPAAFPTVHPNRPLTNAEYPSIRMRCNCPLIPSKAVAHPHESHAVDKRVEGDAAGASLHTSLQYALNVAPFEPFSHPHGQLSKTCSGLLHFAIVPSSCYECLAGVMNVWMGL